MTNASATDVARYHAASAAAATSASAKMIRATNLN